MKGWKSLSDKEPENSLVLDSLGRGSSTWHDRDDETVYSSRQTIKNCSDSYVINYTKDGQDNELKIGDKPTYLALNANKTILLVEGIELAVESGDWCDLVAVVLATNKLYKLDEYNGSCASFKHAIGFDGNKAVAHYNFTRQEWDLTSLLPE